MSSTAENQLPQRDDTPEIFAVAPPRPRRAWWLLPAMLLGALAVRLYGITLGLGMHPDERHIMMVTEKLSLSDWNPHSFAYGSLPFYLLWLVSRAASIFSQFLGHYDGLFYVGRVLSAIGGTISVALTYRLGMLVTRRKDAALLAAGLLAANVFHIQNCHFFTVDGLLTLAALGVLLAALRVLETGSIESHIVTGALIGLACGIKIAGLTLFAPLAAAIVLGSLRRRERLFTAGALERAVTAFASAAAAFVMVEPFAIFDLPTVMHDLTEQATMVTGKWVAPYTLQYLDRTPYLYPLRQILSHTMGWPLGLAAVLGTLYVLLRQLRRFRAEELVLLAWLVPVFGYFGALQVKFPRYLLPLYPVLILFASVVLTELGDRLRRRWGAALGALPAAAVASWTCVYAAAFLTIYASPHVWITASRWIYDNVPRGSSILGEHWDDRIPLSLPGTSADRFVTEGDARVLALYEGDNEKKLENVSRQLAGADYMALATARLYGSLVRLPARFPLTSRYYRLLFAGKLGYRLIRTFHPTPALGPLELDDQLADESFTVYDHPKVTIFRNEEKLTAAEILKRVLDAPEDLATPTFEEIMRAKVETRP